MGFNVNNVTIPVFVTVEIFYSPGYNFAELSWNKFNLSMFLPMTQGYVRTLAQGHFSKYKYMQQYSCDQNYLEGYWYNFCLKGPKRTKQGCKKSSIKFPTILVVMKLRMC